jgi:hypothetical protein
VKDREQTVVALERVNGVRFYYRKPTTPASLGESLLAGGCGRDGEKSTTPGAHSSKGSARVVSLA